MKLKEALEFLESQGVPRDTCKLYEISVESVSDHPDWIQPDTKEEWASDFTDWVDFMEERGFRQGDLIHVNFSNVKH